MFELANEDRLRILILLQQKPMRLTQVSEKLELNMQETSRHLSRLCEAGLVAKDVEGLYRVEPVGREILTLLQGFEFLSKYRDYFNSHDLSALPISFRNRIGELKPCVLSNDVFTSVHFVENVVREAEEYLWMITDQILVSAKPLVDEAVKRRTTKFRLILAEDLIYPPGYVPSPIIAGRMEQKTLKTIDVAIVMSEKEGQLAFRSKDGKMDFRTFTVTDPFSLNWCKELYEYYWQRALTGRPQTIQRFLDQKP
jgi:predicted transcriptional regulator